MYRRTPYDCNPDRNRSHGIYMGPLRHFALVRDTVCNLQSAIRNSSIAHFGRDARNETRKQQRQSTPVSLFHSHTRSYLYTSYLHIHTHTHNKAHHQRRLLACLSGAWTVPLACSFSHQTDRRLQIRHGRVNWYLSNRWTHTHIWAHALDQRAVAVEVAVAPHRAALWAQAQQSTCLLLYVLYCLPMGDIASSTCTSTPPSQLPFPSHFFRPLSDSRPGPGFFDLGPRPWISRLLCQQ